MRLLVLSVCARESVQAMIVIAQGPLADGGTAVASQAGQSCFKGTPEIKSSSNA